VKTLRRGASSGSFGRLSPPFSSVTDKRYASTFYPRRSCRWRRVEPKPNPVGFRFACPCPACGPTISSARGLSDFPPECACGGKSTDTLGSLIRPDETQTRRGRNSEPTHFGLTLPAPACGRNKFVDRATRVTTHAQLHVVHTMFHASADGSGFGKPNDPFVFSLFNGLPCLGALGALPEVFSPLSPDS